MLLQHPSGIDRKVKKNIDLSHDALTILAEKWLKKKNFGVTFDDKFKALAETGEQPDSLGFRNGVSALVECKCSRSDFLADSKKKFRMEPDLGMGDWRFYLCPEGLIGKNEIPHWWGLLWAVKGKVIEVSGVPTNVSWVSEKPFCGNKKAEMSMMYSALRKLTRGKPFSDVYDNLK